MSSEARAWLDRIHALPIRKHLRIMNVCGGHERSISMAGLRGALPANIELIPGPGCPVCICPEEDVYEAIQLALFHPLIMTAFGDMLRVPVNAPKRDARSLEQAKARGADIRPIASPTEAVEIANANPQTKVVFFAAGFETTMAPVAGMIHAGLPDNLYILLSGRLTWPAVAMLLESGETAFDCLIAPGHVATIMGPEEWEFIVSEHKLPAAVAGFTTESLLAAIYSTLRQHLEKRYFLDNCYREVAHPGGNPQAKKLLQATLEVTDAKWRGIGIIPASGYALQPTYSRHDARTLLSEQDHSQRKHIGEMPPGCDCARVVLGKSTRTNVVFTDEPVHHANPSVHAWCQTKAPVEYGGQLARVNRRKPRAPDMPTLHTSNPIKLAGHSPTVSKITRQFLLGGRVQGVGFRPFVYRLATQMHLTGWVRNEHGRVRIVACGPSAVVDRFKNALLGTAPSISNPQLLDDLVLEIGMPEKFTILPSQRNQEADVHLPDFYLCPECAMEINDPADRRFRYPFTNCTQCGPRYTLIKELPYDRPNTTMANFPLCEACNTEYTDPLNRRFHAQPLACPECGPQLQFVYPGHPDLHDTQASLSACLEALHNGFIVAIKGIGGYHLVCDAYQERSVQRLRKRKNRPHKPLAIMVPTADTDELAFVHLVAEVSTQEGDLLRSPARPIVLLKKRSNPALAESIAPGLNEVGVLLPYSPLHYLLLKIFCRPLVVTSANISGEPVLTNDQEVEKRLANIADAFLHHNRPIQRPADDSVYRTLAGKPRPLRLGRGIAPMEIELETAFPEPVLGVGAFLKNTVCLAWGNRAVISPHIGDLQSPRSQQVFQQTISDLQNLYGITARHIAYDAHPQYPNSSWAIQQKVGKIKIFHHHAHASALYGEHQLHDTALMFTWDGTGYGEDGTLWGGEALLGEPGAWRRVASLRKFRLPGGDQASREPWRCALALAWETKTSLSNGIIEHPLLLEAWEKGVNSPYSSAAGRLFDAAAALTQLVQISSFEGQGPAELEACCRHTAQHLQLELTRDKAGIWASDWAPLIAAMQDSKKSLFSRAELFHASMAQIIIDQALKINSEYGVTQIGLCGGVFQNRVLCRLAAEGLRRHGFQVFFSDRIPCNDGGISFGQVIEAGAVLTKHSTGIGHA